MAGHLTGSRELYYKIGLKEFENGYFFTSVLCIDPNVPHDKDLTG